MRMLKKDNYQTIKKTFFILIALLCAAFLKVEKKKCSSIPLLVWGFSLEGYPITQEKLKTLEKDTHIRPRLIQFYLQWPEDPLHKESINTSLKVIEDQGSVPCLTWEPMYIKNNKEHTIPFKQILQGKYDTYLINMANELQARKRIIIIRFAQEMNLQRYHWGSEEEKEFGPQSTQLYKDTFKYIVNLFRKQQAHNVLWAFCPNHASVPDDAWNQPINYYPGNEYIDILGMDGYNWDIHANNTRKSWTQPWQSFEDLFKPIYEKLKKISNDKPILVFETASVSREGGKRKPDWILGAIETAKKWDLLGIVWFQIEKEEDWRINQNNEYDYEAAIRYATNPLVDYFELIDE